MTEHGQVPKGWVTKPLNDLVDFLDSQRRPIKSADRSHMRGQYPYYGASGIIDWVNDYLFDEELILLGEDGENILSRNLPLAFRVSGKVWVNNHAHVFRPKRGIVDIRFLTELLEFQDYADLNSGTAQPKLNKASCKALQLTYPEDLKEQEAIAEALSDADALIEGLERLIAKKRLIKQGAMQDLLTAKRRLPGFSGAWTTAPLRQLCSQIQDGTHFTPTYVEYGTPFYSVENVTARNFDRCKYVTPEAHEAMAKRCRPTRGDILMTRIGSIGDTYLVDWDHEASIYVSLCLLRPGKSIDARYLYAYSRSSMFVKEVEDRSLPNAIPKKINLGDIADVQISMPIDSNEQAEIAAVLTDMDAEIQALDTRLEKARQVKEGMMQNLLTGRIRLV